MNKHLAKLLLAILVWGSAFGVHSEERPHRPALKEHKSIAVPIWTAPDTKDKSRSSAREMESPKPIPPKVPPTVMDRIPPKKIGDLSCPQVDDAAKQACDNTCAQHPNTPCALLCTYRKNDEGKCVLWVECTSACGEIPAEVETPTGR
jgi:hypothetical protein